MLKAFELMCRDLTFDEDYAASIVNQININQELISSRFHAIPYKSTLLNEAVMSNNIRMVRFLLKSGADPNLLFDDGSECVLWGLQYPGDDTPEDDEIRLQMAQILLENGAEPGITTEDGWEDLFTWVASAIFNDDMDDLWEYRARFFILIVAYGGNCDYCKPRIVGAFDKSKMQQYRLFLVPEENNKFSGIIKDGKGKNIVLL